MRLNTEQDNIVGKAFMIAMARKLYREGSIDTATMNRLVIRIEKIKDIGKVDKREK
ncbi:MAG: hypothetical protein IK093_06830 [Ruminiclostridium sp.]|nr:hypothetical protein [Ruminiclostridium sp.]